MKYKGIEFDAIVATPGCGKSYLCDKYPNKFVDVDELRLRCKYYVPENITRLELEQTKGDRTFEKRSSGDEYLKELDKRISQEIAAGKILICAPHVEVIDYLKKHNLKFCLVYQSKDMKQEFIDRMVKRGNSEKIIKENSDMFDEFYKMNVNEKDSVVKYEYSKNEYLEDIVKIFGCKIDE